MAGHAAIGDGGAPNIPVGVELLEMPVAGAIFIDEVEAPVFALFYCEIVRQGTSVVDLQHQDSARRQRLTGFRNLDGFRQRIAVSKSSCAIFILMLRARRSRSA